MGSSVGEAPLATRLLMPFAGGLLAGGVSRPGPVWTLVVAVIVVTAMARRQPLSRRALLAAAAAGVALGSLSAALASLPVAADHLARVAGPGSAAVEGVIVSSEQAGERVTAVVRVEQVRSRRRRGPASGLLGVTIAHARRSWPVGNHVRIVGRLRRPRNLANPGGYDLEAALARRGIRVTMFLWDDEGIAPLPASSASAGAWIDTVRAALAARIVSQAGEPVRGYLTAVLLGATQSVDRETRMALSRTGLTHVISVSGFHIAVAAGACFFSLRWLALRLGVLALRIDVGKLAAVVGLLPVGVYAAIAGDSVPAVRAFLMYGVLLGALVYDRPPDGMRALGVAAVMLAVSRPDIAADVSFELSFVSVAALILLTTGRGDRQPNTGAGPTMTINPGPRAGGRSSWWQTFVIQPLCVSLAATVATAPLTAWHFQQISLIAPLANLIALPLLGPATLLPGLVALPFVALVPPVADAMLAMSGWAAALGLALADRMARLPWAAIATPMPSLLEVALCYAILALSWFRPANWGTMLATTEWPRARRCAVAVVVVLALADGGYWLWERFGDASLRVTFLSVGQGDAAVVELPYGGVLVIDGGGFPGDFDTGERLIAPFLRSRKILHLDAIALSHPQLDHFGGLAYLVEHFAPREFWSNGTRGRGDSFERLEAAIRASGTRSVVLSRGDRRRLGPDVGLETLHPDRLDGASVNDASLVLRLTHGSTSMLFAGDIERPAERALLQAKMALRSDVLKVPHHGSATSTTAPWLGAVAPTVAIISSGMDNRFGFPAPEVVRRLRQVGAAVWNTAENGAVRIVSDGRRVGVTSVRPSTAPERFEFPTSLW